MKEEVVLLNPDKMGYIDRGKVKWQDIIAIKQIKLEDSVGKIEPTGMTTVLASYISLHSRTKVLFLNTL